MMFGRGGEHLMPMAVDVSVWRLGSDPSTHLCIFELEDLPVPDDAIDAIKGSVGEDVDILMLTWLTDPDSAVTISPAVFNAARSVSGSIRLVGHHSETTTVFVARIDVTEMTALLDSSAAECVRVVDSDGSVVETVPVTVSQDVVEALRDLVADNRVGHGSAVEVVRHARGRGAEVSFDKALVESLAGLEARLSVRFLAAGPDGLDPLGRWCVATPVPHACEELAVELEDADRFTFDTETKSYFDMDSGVLEHCPFCEVSLKDTGITVARFTPTIPASHLPQNPH